MAIVQEERAAAAPTLSRDQIQAQKRRGSAMPTDGAAFNRRDRRNHQRTEEGELAAGEVEMDAQVEPSLECVGRTGQRSYETLPLLEVRVAVRAFISRTGREYQRPEIPSRGSRCSLTLAPPLACPPHGRRLVFAHRMLPRRP